MFIYFTHLVNGSEPLEISAQMRNGKIGNIVAFNNEGCTYFDVSKMSSDQLETLLGEIQRKSDEYEDAGWRARTDLGLNESRAIIDDCNAERGLL